MELNAVVEVIAEYLFSSVKIFFKLKVCVLADDSFSSTFECEAQRGGKEIHSY